MSDGHAERHPVRGKCVCNVKHNTDRSVEQYNTQIVVGGYSHIEALD